jgi:hypothetical protein
VIATSAPEEDLCVWCGHSKGHHNGWVSALIPFELAVAHFGELIDRISFPGACCVLEDPAKQGRPEALGGWKFNEFLQLLKLGEIEPQNHLSKIYACLCPCIGYTSPEEFSRACTL